MSLQTPLQYANLECSMDPSQFCFHSLQVAWNNLTLLFILDILSLFFLLLLNVSTNYHSNIIIPDHSTTQQTLC